MDFGTTSILSMPSICDSSMMPPPQLQSTTNNESKNDSKKRKTSEQSYMDQSNIQVDGRKRLCRKD
jgi:hypothetical protein